MKQEALSQSVHRVQHLRVLETWRRVNKGCLANMDPPKRVIWWGSLCDFQSCLCIWCAHMRVMHTYSQTHTEKSERELFTAINILHAHTREHTRARAHTHTWTRTYRLIHKLCSHKNNRNHQFRSELKWNNREFPMKQQLLVNYTTLLLISTLNSILAH